MRVTARTIMNVSTTSAFLESSRRVGNCVGAAWESGLQPTVSQLCVDRRLGLVTVLFVRNSELHSELHCTEQGFLAKRHKLRDDGAKEWVSPNVDGRKATYPLNSRATRGAKRKTVERRRGAKNSCEEHESLFGLV